MSASVRVDHAPLNRRFALAKTDPPVFERCGRAGQLPVLLVCDHASRAVPCALADLGLSRAQLRRHIAWDIGAAALTRALAAHLELTALLSGYSRLVIDCNRRLEDPTSIPAQSDGCRIPGNSALCLAERELRAQACFWPYHAAIATELAALQCAGTVPVLIAVHSFTPVMQDYARPWHCGVLWDRDARIAAPLLQALRAHADTHIGDNEPYSGRHPAGYTTHVHAQARGLAHVSLEIRQDLIDSPPGVASWAERLCAALRPILAAASLYHRAG
jgi:predicted N-formylglutamate amidohydrolase